MIDDSNLEYFLPLLPRRAKGKEIMAGVISEELPVGAILASIRERAVSIVSLFVLPEFRQKGVGRFMLESFCEALRSRGAECIFAYGPDEIGVKECLTGCGFSIASIDRYYTISIKDIMGRRGMIEKIKSYMKATAGRNVMNMKQITERLPSEAKRSFSRMMDKRGVNPKAFINGGYDEELSYGVIMDTHISGILLTNRTEIESEVVVESLITIGDRLDALALMTRFATDVFPIVGREGNISFVTGDSNTDKLMTQLLGKDIMTSRNAIHAGRLL